MKKTCMHILCAFISCLLITTSASAQSWLWAKQGSVNGGLGWYNDSRSVATDAAGYIYVTGSFDGNYLKLGTTIRTNISGIHGTSMFLAKMDPAGHVLWIKSTTGRCNAYGQSVCMDPSGNVILAGYFSGMDMGYGGDTVADPDYSKSTETTMFVIKCDSSGNPLWMRNASGNSVHATRVSSDPFGNIILSGTFVCSTLKIGSYTLTNRNEMWGSDQLFLAKYDASGNVRWANTAGSSVGTGANEVKGTSIDSRGTIYAAGSFRDTAYFGSTVLIGDPAAGPSCHMVTKLFFARYDSSGVMTWVKTGPLGEHYDDAFAISRDKSGLLYVLGDYNYGGYNDMYIRKYDTLGNLLWSKTFSGKTLPYAATFDNSDNLVVIGNYYGNSVTIGSATLANADSATTNCFLAKFDTAGNPLNAAGFGGDYIDNVYGLAIAPSGSTYITGSYSSSKCSIGSYTLTNPGIDTVSIYVARYDTGKSPTLFTPQKINSENKLSIYPNPAAHTIVVSSGEMIRSLSVIDLLGKTVFHQNYNAASVTVGLPDIAPGPYFIKVNETSFARFVKQ